MSYIEKLDKFAIEVKDFIITTINKLNVSDEDGVAFNETTEIQEGVLIGLCGKEGNISAMVFNEDDGEVGFIDYEFLSIEELVFIADNLLEEEFEIKNILDIG